MKLYIVEIDPAVRKIMMETPLPKNVLILHGSAMVVKADALVSPANSFGIMRGGFDKVIANHIPGIESIVQKAIRAVTGKNTLPVGQTITVPVEHPSFHKLIVAPTMDAPGGKTSLPQIAKVARAIFHNNRNLGSIVMTPLGTGVGGIDLKDSILTIIKAFCEEFPDNSK